MYDVVIRNGLLVDGTGRPSRHADVGIRDGRVVALGSADEPAERTIDATDLVVAPGFIDIHTHYDAQIFWDGTLSPSPLHGVTSVIGGNCGFSIAPLTSDDAGYLLKMLSRVEGMPREALEAGVPWDWSSTGDYLDRVDGATSPNVGFLVGHSALRRVVMHDDAIERAATPEEVAAMGRLLADGLGAGALGFSSTWSRSHNDHEGHPVPSRHASRQELLDLCAVVRNHPGTTLEFIPGTTPFGPERVDLMAAMSCAADRPLNWNVLQVYGKNRELVDELLTASDVAEVAGGRVVALTLPDTLRTRLNLRSGFILDILPGWETLMALPPEAKLAALRDPAQRAEWDRLAQSATGPMRTIANWSSYIIVESHDPSVVGRTVGDVARERGTGAWDTLAAIAVTDELETVIENPDRGQDDATWERRVEVWRDHRTIVGASDAGAHLDMIDSFSYCTTLLARTVRERDLLAIEEAVRLLTGDPAQLYGLVDRGVLAEGSWADIVVFDLDRIGPRPVQTRRDLPSGAGRLYGAADGVEHVLVAGRSIVEGPDFTDERPGRVLRSGRDTATVVASASDAQGAGRL
ncbi:MAG TPA: amidohydrolase family protein [Acidimicrobiales bacterium]|nr:amidohydrolase family protein [Acidimicrobiales bacterium]